MKKQLAGGLRNLGAYNKAIAAALGGTGTTILAVLGLTDVLPETVSGWLTGAAAFVTAASVFMVKNQDLIDAAGDSAAAYLDK